MIVSITNELKNTQVSRKCPLIWRLTMSSLSMVSSEEHYMNLSELDLHVNDALDFHDADGDICEPQAHEEET